MPLPHVEPKTVNFIISIRLLCPNCFYRIIQLFQYMFNQGNNLLRNVVVKRFCNTSVQ